MVKVHFMGPGLCKQIEGINNEASHLSESHKLHFYRSNDLNGIQSNVKESLRNFLKILNYTSTVGPRW